jgi:hypothetical protein
MVKALSTVMIFPLRYTVSALGGGRDAQEVIKLSTTRTVKAFRDLDKEVILDLLYGGSVSHGGRGTGRCRKRPGRGHCAGLAQS